MQYAEQWLERQKITDIKELEEFDKKYPNANLGNMTQNEYVLLQNYHNLINPKEQKDFLDAHPELTANKKYDWLKSHPEENALLALHGQAKILSLSAYKEVKRLIKELDYPDDGLPPMTLPPETSIDTHFKYEEMVTEGKHGSWEAQLLLLKDAESAEEAGVKSYAEWRGLKLSDTPIASLELKVKNRELYDKLASYSDKDSPNYLDDKIKDAEGLTARDRAIKDLKAKNPEWVDDMRRIEAIENMADDKTKEAWVERGKLIDRFSAGSSEAMLWLVEHPDVHKWALAQELLEDDGSDWNVPVLRINVRWRKQDEEYNRIADSFKYITNPDERADKIAQARKDFLAKNPRYNEDRYRRDAYSFTGPAPFYKKFPDNQVETYVQWHTNPALEKPPNWKTDKKTDLWYEDDWWLLEHKDFYKAMLDIGLWKEERDFSKVPTREVFKKYLYYLKLGTDANRKIYRTENLDLDAWGVSKFGWKSITEQNIRSELTAAERRAEDFAIWMEDIEERLRKLREPLRRD